MHKVMTLLAAAGALAGIGCLASATSAEAGGFYADDYDYDMVYYRAPGCCAPVVYYRPAAYCPPYNDYYFAYTKTTQYRPVARSYRVYRPVSYPPIRARRR